MYETTAAEAVIGWVLLYPCRDVVRGRAGSVHSLSSNYSFSVDQQSVREVWMESVLFFGGIKRVKGLPASPSVTEMTYRKRCKPRTSSSSAHTHTHTKTHLLHLLSTTLVKFPLVTIVFFRLICLAQARTKLVESVVKH